MRRHFTSIQAGLLRAISLAHASQGPSCDPTPFWWLFLHLELLLLHPTSSNNRDGESIQSTIAARIASFQDGHIEELWTSATAIISSPTSTSPPTPGPTNKAIQHSADSDNWRTAYNRACSNQQKATISNSNESLIHDLYVPPYAPIHPANQPTTPHPTPQQHNLPGDICETIKQLPKGKANGIIADSVDAFSRLVRLNNPSVNADLQFFFNAIFTNKIPPALQPYLRDTYLFCLHKDPNDPSKLRPIGVPTAIRRIIGNHIARSYRQRFALHLLPHNFAVGVSNGQDFVIKTTQLAIEKYITGPQNEGHLPSRAVIFTDMTNMFNLISREELRDCLRSHFPELIQVADLFYQEPGTVHFQHGSGDWFNLLMEEGVNQGCPLSSIFAALVFHRVLAPLQAALNDRANDRVLRGDLGDDGCGSVSIITAFVDDNSNVIPLEDISFFFTELDELAPPRGCRLNSFKTRILTSTNGMSPLPALRLTNPPLAESIEQAITTYSISKATNPTDPPIPVELTEGCRLLGAPVGSARFARDFCFQRVAAAIADAHTLTTSVSDLQTRLRLFSQCTIHKLPHLLGYDVLHHLPLDYDMSGVNWEGWEGPLIDATNHLISNFFKQLLGLSTSLPSHSLFIAQGGIPSGGLGLYRPGARAIPDFVLTMAKASNYAEHGIRFHAEAPNYILPSSIRSLYNLASNTSSLTLQRFRHALPTIALIAVSHRVPSDQRIDHFLTRTSTNSARHRLRIHTSCTTTSLIYNETPIHLRHVLPGALSSHTSYPLIHMSRSNAKHRLNNFDFTIMLKRKLVLPLYHPASAPVCKCGATHDIYGHHHFRCTRISKKFVHDYINTQALQPVLQQVLRTAGITDNSSPVQTEVPHHIQQQPLLRPFDIEYQPNHSLGDSNLPPSRFAICGADITIDHCPDPPSASALEDISLYTANAERCLQTAEMRKFTTMGNSTVTGNTMTREDVLHTLSTNAKLLQIWAICPYGGMGPMLRKFLFGDDPIRPLSFTPNKPHAAKMYLESLQSSARVRKK